MIFKAIQFLFKLFKDPFNDFHNKNVFKILSISGIAYFIFSIIPCIDFKTLFDFRSEPIVNTQFMLNYVLSDKLLQNLKRQRARRDLFSITIPALALCGLGCMLIMIIVQLTKDKKVKKQETFINDLR